MGNNNTPAVRYYARFLSDHGRVEAVIKFHGYRICIATPIVISRHQRCIVNNGTAAAVCPELYSRLCDYTTAIGKVLPRQLANNNLSSATAKTLQAVIGREYKIAEGIRNQVITANTAPHE